MDVTHCCRQSPSASLLFEQIGADDIDAAIESGLMEFVDCRACRASDADYAAMADVLTATRARLAQAWSARERYRAHNARLAQRTAERNTRRTASANAGKRPSLPAAAAAILARAKAKAAERSAK